MTGSPGGDPLWYWWPFRNEGKKGSRRLTEFMTVNGTTDGILRLTFRRLLCI